MWFSRSLLSVACLSIALTSAAEVAAQAAAPTATATPPPAAAATPAPTPAPAPAPVAADGAETGRIAWYGTKFAGRKTASGENFNPEALTMAHKSLPFGTKVKVTNKANGRSAVLRVNDRGPTQADRMGDVSLAAARQLKMTRAGIVEAELTVVASPAPGKK